MSQGFPRVAVERLPSALPCLGRAARWFAALCIVTSSAGCVLTQDIPDPALDIPGGYKAAKLIDPDAPPMLDWWRGFSSPELTELMEEAQRVNLDIAAAVARFKQADAQARVAGAALLPQLSASGPGNILQEILFKGLRLQRKWFVHRRTRGGQLQHRIERQLHTRFLGPISGRRAGSRGDLGCEPL